jgi:hypothetical protein
MLIKFCSQYKGERPSVRPSAQHQVFAAQSSDITGYNSATLTLRINKYYLDYIYI